MIGFNKYLFNDFVSKFSRLDEGFCNFPLQIRILHEKLYMTRSQNPLSIVLFVKGFNSVSSLGKRKHLRKMPLKKRKLECKPYVRI